MDPMIAGIVGAAIGIAGGIIGTHYATRNTSSSRERAFYIKAGVIAWFGVGVFLGLLFALPSPYRHLLWIPWGILGLLGVVMENRGLQKIRQEESQSGLPPAAADGTPDE